MSRRILAVVALCSALFASTPAQGQSLALNRFNPAPAGDRFPGVPSPYVVGHLQPNASLNFEYAHNPLLLRRTTDLSTVGPIVSRQTFFRLNASLSLFQRVLLNVELPAVILQSGSDASGIHAADVGDIRLGLRSRLYGDNGEPFQLAINGYFWIPTGTGKYVTDGKIRGVAPQIIAGGLIDSVVWSASIGPEIRSSQTYLDIVPQGSALTSGLAIGILLGSERQAQLGVESNVSFVFAKPEARNTNAELLFHARYRIANQLEVAAGAGPGLGVGLGTPAFRAMLSFAYAPNAPIIPPKPREEIIAEKIVNEDLDSQEEFVQEEPEPTDVAKPAPSTMRVEILPEEIILGDEIHFDTGRSTIKPQSDELLDDIAEMLIIHPEIRRVEIRGHTDIRGTLEVNMRLAERRAQAVRKALVQRSVDPTRLVAKGYGPNEPASSNGTAAGRKRNRRVEFRILERSPANTP